MRRRGRSKKRARRAPQARRRAGAPQAAFEGLEQRHFDLIGLIMVAAGVYCAFVLYLGWDGGRVGGWLETALSYTVAGSSTSCR